MDVTTTRRRTRQSQNKSISLQYWLNLLGKRQVRPGVGGGVGGGQWLGGVHSRYTERVFSKPSPLILSWDLRVRGQTSKSSNLLWANGGAYRAGGSYPLLAVKRMEAASCAHWRLSWLNLYLEIPVNSLLGPTWCQWFWSLFCTRPTLLGKR